MPSDSLLTLDLKSGSKVNIGTYVITLDKFLEGQIKSTRTLDIGNGKLGRVHWDVSVRLPITSHILFIVFKFILRHEIEGENQSSASHCAVTITTATV